MYRFSVLSVAVLTLAGTFASDAFADGNYHHSCSNSRLVVDDSHSAVTLWAECDKEHGGKIHAAINLGNLIANDDGHLAWRANGGFMGSCTSLVLHAPVLGAICQRNDGSTTPFASINLAENIANENGRLEYVGP